MNTLRILDIRMIDDSSIYTFAGVGSIKILLSPPISLRTRGRKIEENSSLGMFKSVSNPNKLSLRSSMKTGRWRVDYSNIFK